MNYTVLCDEISTDPLGCGYATMSNADVAQALNEPNREVPDSTRYTVREYLNRFGLEGVDEMRANVEAASRTAMEALTDYGGEGGLDFSHPKTREAIDGLQKAKAITADQADKWKSLGVKTVSRAVELGIGTVTDGHVGSAKIRLGE